MMVDIIGIGEAVASAVENMKNYSIVNNKSL